MGRKGAIHVLVFIAGLLLSEHGAKGQMMGGEPAPSTSASTLVFESTTSGVAVVSSNECTSHVESGQKLCSEISGISDINAFLAAGDLSSVCTHSMLTYGCASLGDKPASTITAIMRCFLGVSNAVTSQESFSLIISQLSLDTIGAVINSLNNVVPSSSIPDVNKQYLLTAVWEKLYSDPNNLTPGVMATWFQEKMYSYVPFISIDMLDCMNSLPLTCDTFGAIVGALDVSYSKFDLNMKEVIGLWITRYLQAHDCSESSATLTIQTYFQSFVNNINYTNFVMVLSTAQLGAATDSFTDFQLAQYVSSSNVFASYETALPVLQLLATKDFTYVLNFLTILQAGDYDQEILYSLLYDTLTKINYTDTTCRPKLKAIFQGKLSYLFTAINSSVLDLFVISDCSDFQDIFGAIDEIYPSLTGDQQSLVYQYRLNYLNGEAAKSGSACTYGLTSSQWLQMNFGQSTRSLLYLDMLRLNPTFDGYSAISLLTVSQTIDLIVKTNLLSSPNPDNYEEHVTSIISHFKIKGFQYVQLFLIELRTVLIRLNINFFITNVKCRTMFLQGIWEIVITEFHQFGSNEWYMWFNEHLYIFLPSFSSKELSVLSYSMVEDCSNMQTIVGGLNNAFTAMDENSKSDVTNWIIGYLRNDTSKCPGGSDWLVNNFQQFKSYVSITVVRELNPDFNLMDSIQDLTAAQIGQGVVTESGALSSVSYMHSVFEVITNTTEPVASLGSFWDNFNSEYEQIEQFTVEVKYSMLEWTVEEIEVKFSTFKSVDYTVWIEKRLYLVTTVINRTILDRFPKNPDCDSYKAIVKAFSANYDATFDTSRQDVFNFLTNYLAMGIQCSETENSTVIYIKNSFGNYSANATYEQLIRYNPKFNPLENGVLPLLNAEQTGDMLVVSQVYQSIESVTTVFQYLQTVSIELVDNCMAQFTATAIKKKITIDITVGQYILKSYFNIIKSNLVTYSHTQITQLFQRKIYVLIQFFKVETLNMFAVEDCDTMEVVVAQLDTGFNSMSEQTRQMIAYWIYGIINTPHLHGCTTSSQTTAVWSGTTFKRFFGYMTIKELVVIKPSLDVISIINSTSISQKVEYLVSSKTVLQNVTTTRTVLESLPETNNVVSVTNIYSFTETFNAAYSSLNVQTMTSEVREECMTYLFTNLVSDLNSVTTAEIDQFTTQFQYFFAGTTTDIVNEIPETINCDVYKGLFSGFSSAKTQIGDDVNQGIFDKMIAVLLKQNTGSTDACSSLYTDSKSYIENVFFEYKEYATIYQYKSFYKEFDVTLVLNLLTGKQLGNQFMNSTATSDVFKAVPILTEIEKRSYSDVCDFMSEIAVVAQEIHVTTLPNANVETLLYQSVWPTIVTHLQTRSDYEQWFTGSLDLILSSVSATAFAALPHSSDCYSQSLLISSFSNVYDKQDDDQRNSVYQEINTFNMHRKNTTGSACETITGTSIEWIQTYVGPYVKQGKLPDFEQSNPNFTASSALIVLSGVQVANYTIETHALRKEETTVQVFNSMDTTQKLQDFLQQINHVAPTELSESPVVSLIVTKTFEVISQDFETFTTETWTLWTQQIMTNILYASSATDIELIPLPMACDSYQAIVQGFDQSFSMMSEETKLAVYNTLIKRQLSSVSAQNGVRCGKSSWKSQEWVDVNFARFYVFANVTDFFVWNINFQPTSVMDTLSPGQLAVVAVQSIQKEEVACQVAGRVQQFSVNEADSFLNTFSVSIQMTSNAQITDVTIASKFLSASLTALSSAFSSYSGSDWDDLFNVKLQPFLFTITAEQLSSILASSDCNGYNVIVKSLSSIFSNISPATQKSIYGALTAYLGKKPSGTCPVSGEDSKTSVTRLFGEFKVYAAYSDYNKYIQNFDGLSAIDLLSADQKANLAFTGDILSNPSKAQTLVSSVTAMSFSDVDSFLSSFQAIAQQKGLAFLPDANIQASLFSACYGIVSQQFSTFTNEQWSNYWNYKFSIFLPSITESQIQLIPGNINCNAYQSVISGFSSHYSSLTLSAQNAAYTFIRSYLTANKQVGGPACPVNSGGSSAWLEVNFGFLAELAPIQDITILFPGFVFTDAIPNLTADQLGFYVASNSVLSDKDKVAKVMGGIISDTVGEFMDSFNAGVKAAGITSISSSVVNTFFLGELFCKLGPVFSSFTTNDYTTWFGTKLSFFISSIDAKSLGFISADISCDSLAAIMGPLDKAKNPQHPGDIYNFAKSVLQAQQKATGVACTSAGMDSATWIQTYFGVQYITVAPWSDIIALYPHIQVTQIVSYLNEVQLAAASASSTVIQNSATFTTVVFSFNGSMEGFLTFIGSIKNSYLLNPTIMSNNKIRDTLLMAVADIVFANFGDLDLPTTQSWLTAISFLLPGLNSTMLQQIPLDITCLQYQAIVSAVSAVSSSLAPARLNDFANFQISYLNNQYNLTGEACVQGTSGTINYIEANIGTFCSYFKPEDIAKYNSAITPVSFTTFCNLS